MVLVALTLSLATANSQTTLVSAGGTWHYHKGTNAPQTDWKSATDAALNLEWATGLGGFGYGDSDDATLLTTMSNRYTTVYIRQSFNIAAPLDSGLSLRLTVDYDDAYVAYLDGQEIARSANIVGGVVVSLPPANRASDCRWYR